MSRGVQLSNLQSVLDFMYNGEANVAKEELNFFLALAEELKVRGLTENQSSKKSESNSSAPHPESAAPCLLDEQSQTRRLTNMHLCDECISCPSVKCLSHVNICRSFPCETDCLIRSSFDDLSRFSSCESLGHSST